MEPNATIVLMDSRCAWVTEHPVLAAKWDAAMQPTPAEEDRGRAIFGEKEWRHMRYFYPESKIVTVLDSEMSYADICAGKVSAICLAERITV